MFVIGTPSVPSSSSKSFPTTDLVGSTSNALPYGRAALALLGGKTTKKEKTTGPGSDFPEEKIVIPAGITPQNLAKYTLYDVLGLVGELGDAADTEIIRKAYHKAVLMYHPDKAQYKTDDGKEDRSVFLKIQDAFNVLTNVEKRRAYDSQLPFDESIPSEEKVQRQLAKGPQKFFKLFAPVFQRNARFAVKKPVPDLGDMNTPITDVYKFYEYWVHFESWRDFTGVGAEHKPDEATSREEKRWMMKENEKLAKKLKTKEMQRLIALEALAEKYDPRIVADKEGRRLAKEAEKAAKENAIKAKADEEAAAKAWAEKLEEEERERKAANKMDREKLKKAQSKQRNILRKLLRLSASMGHGSGEYGVLSTADAELICANCQLEELTEMNDAMGGEAATKEGSESLVKAEGFEFVASKVAAVKSLADQALEDERFAREAKKREAEEKAAIEKRKKAGTPPPERVWARDEYSMLAKCIVRYPPGVQARWISITNYMNVQLRPKEMFSQEELLRAAYTLAHNPNLLKA